MGKALSGELSRLQIGLVVRNSGPSCSKLTMSLVNVSLKFQTLISIIGQYFFLKKCEKLLQWHGVQKLLSFCQQKISVY